MKLNDRQSWLLIYLLSRHPVGITRTNEVPYSCNFNGRYYRCPVGIGMGNIRGLQKRGFVFEPRIGFFYLTENGVLAAQEAANDDRWRTIPADVGEN